MAAEPPAAVEDAAPAPAPETSRTDGAFAALVGLAALGLLAASPFLVDTSGPDPFYKGPLIFPIVALSIAVLGAAPSTLAGLRAARWRIDGRGFPSAAVRLFLLASLFAPAIAAVGLDLATFVFVALGLALVGDRRPGRLLLAAAGITGAVDLAFVSALDIWFPSPWLWPWLTGSG